MTTKSRTPARHEVKGEKLTSGNGSRPDLGTFAVWRALTAKWDSPRKLKTEYRRRFGKESRIRNEGARFYLITPEEGEIILEELGRPLAELKQTLDRSVGSIDDTLSMDIADFDISPRDADGNKTLSLVLEEAEGKEGQQQVARDRILEDIGAGELELPDLATTIDIGTIAGNGSRKDFKPVMNAHMPQGKALSFGGALLMHRPPQPSVDV